MTLNSAGRAATQIFLQDLQYKVTLENSAGSIIWTADPVYASDYSTYAQAYSYAGTPNGNVAGTAGSGTVPADMVWDRTNNILYVCTTTGTSSTAVWTAVNATAATQATPYPQGRLTPTSATPVLATDVSSTTALVYTPYVGNLVPIYNGSSMAPTTFSELSLGLVSAHAASTIYDLFVFSNSGVVTLVTGPAWSVSTAGSGARGTGASTTQLTRLNGLWVNTVQITGRNGSTTYTIAANMATYVGSIFIDGTAGQLTCHMSWGQSRKFGLWNAYNRVPIVLKAGDSTAAWTYATATTRSSNNAAANKLTVFSGLAEEIYALEMNQRVDMSIAANGAGQLRTVQFGIGVNSTSSLSSYAVAGMQENGTSAVGSSTSYSTRHILTPAIGIQDISALEVGNSIGTWTFYGTETQMVLSATWMG